VSAVYRSTAALYDALYSFKDYAREAAQLEVLLAALGVPAGGSVVEGALGTGGHAAHLRGRYAWSGFDASVDMLEVARSKLPDVPLWVADLRAFLVDEPVDAFVCLFSSIGYLLDEAALRACAVAAARAVRPGGALVVEPWLTADTWRVGRPTLQTFESDELKLARATVSEREGDVAVMPMTWVVAARGRPVTTFTETHRLWLAPTDLLLRVFDEAGFSVRSDPAGLTGRGLILGVRRAE
jgi:ubiquinone/menaquinone biosynthesis C-methylase UbiE